MIKGDATEILALAVGLKQAGVRAGVAIREPVLAAGEMIVDAWQAGARVSSGAHGIHYPDAISAELVFDLGGVAVDMGPETGKPQGGMSFERGSRNQPAHNDLAKSADLIGPAFRGEVRRMVDGWFWPGAE